MFGSVTALQGSEDGVHQSHRESHNSISQEFMRRYRYPDIQIGRTECCIVVWGGQLGIRCLTGQKLCQLRQLLRLALQRGGLRTITITKELAHQGHLDSLQSMRLILHPQHAAVLSFFSHHYPRSLRIHAGRFHRWHHECVIQPGKLSAPSRVLKLF